MRDPADSFRQTNNVKQKHNLLGGGKIFSQDKRNLNRFSSFGGQSCGAVFDWHKSGSISFCWLHPFMKIKWSSFLKSGLILGAGLSRGECIIVKHHCKTKLWSVSRSQGLWVFVERKATDPPLCECFCVGGRMGAGIFQYKMKQGQIIKGLPKMSPKALSSTFKNTDISILTNFIFTFNIIHQIFLHKGSHFPCSVIQKLHLLYMIEVRLKMFCNLVILSRGPNRD